MKQSDATVVATLGANLGEVFRRLRGYASALTDDPDNLVADAVHAVVKRPGRLVAGGRLLTVEGLIRYMRRLVENLGRNEQRKRSKREAKHAHPVTRAVILQMHPTCVVESPHDACWHTGHAAVELADICDAGYTVYSGVGLTGAREHIYCWVDAG